MTDFYSKMHQIRFRPAGGAYSAPPDTLAGFKGAYTSKGREGKGGEERRAERRGWAGEGRGGEGEERGG